jgi:formyl-CoA transferase
MQTGNQTGPLVGYRALELGNLIAAPYTGRLFAEFGAEVIKVERPRGGDELRQWRLFRGQTSMMWYTQARNKKSITLDLRKPEGHEVVLELLRHVDVVFENFRPGTLEKWNLGYDVIKRVNPDVILVRISGYGQTGPYHDRPGFASVAEAMGGLRNLVGYPDRPPTRVGVSLGDSLAGMFGAIGALMALLRRERARRQNEDSEEGSAATADAGKELGQVVDVALYESIFAVMESLVPEYDAYNVVRQRTGNLLPGIAPSNAYPCQGGKWVVIGGNADAIYKRLMQAIDRPDLAEDPRFQHNPGRWEHHEFLDQVIAAWTSERTLEEVMSVMVEVGVPAGPIYDAMDIVEDPHFHARGMLEAHEVAIEPDESKQVRFPGIIPKLSETPGSTRWLGPELGEHNEEIYRNLLNLTPEQIEQLKQAGVI